MKRILITIMLALGLLLIPSPVSAASGVEVVERSGDGTWEGSTWKVGLYPNETKSTAIKLYNSSSSSLGVEVSTQPDSLDNGNLAFELNETNFTMSGGSHFDVVLTVKASGNATPGTYTAEFTITFEVASIPTDEGSILTYTAGTNLFGAEGSLSTDYYGKVLKNVEATSEDGKLAITVPEGTTALGPDGKRLKNLSVEINEDPPELPEDTNIIGLAYDFEPSGATFDPPMTLVWSYDSDTLPEDVDEDSLVLAFWDGEAWIGLDCVVDTESNTITASVAHFTTFAVVGKKVSLPVELEEPEPYVVEEPILPTVEEPTPVEPEIIEPEVVEPEVIEPEMVEPLTPEEPESKMPWELIAWIIAGGVVAVVSCIGCWLRWRKKKSK